MVAVETDNSQLRVEMLGGFVIVSDGNRIVEQEKRSTKTWKLLQYLVVNRHKTVSQEELMDVFFDNEFVGNPGSSVRTMVYRARSALTNGGLPFADDVIVSGSGGYAWNSTVRCSVDVEEFETLCKKASSITDREERLSTLMQAVSLYRGDFLPSSSSEMWVMPLARWYRSLYFNCVHEALELLIETDRNDDAEELCVKALRMDPFDETILEYHLRSLLAQGKNSEAIEEYNRMESMFYDELGVDFSEELRSLYAKIQNTSANNTLSLDETLQSWLEDANSPGAFFCDLSVFKVVYQLEARSTSRSGRATYIVRFDVRHAPNAKDGGVMSNLSEAITKTLRKGDIYTRSGPGQYMLMLHKLTYENCKMLVNKILQSLETKHLSKIVGTTIKPITPII